MTVVEYDAVIHKSISGSTQNVWDKLMDIQQVARAVPDVLNIIVSSEVHAKRRLVDWRIWLKGFELQWQEEQIINEHDMRIEFHQIQGIFTIYRGFWQVSTAEDRAQIEFGFQLDSGFPHLSKYINPVILSAFETFSFELMDVFD